MLSTRFLVRISAQLVAVDLGSKALIHNPKRQLTQAEIDEHVRDQLLRDKRRVERRNVTLAGVHRLQEALPIQVSGELHLDKSNRQRYRQERNSKQQ